MILSTSGICYCRVLENSLRLCALSSHKNREKVKKWDEVEDKVDILLLDTKGEYELISPLRQISNNIKPH